MKNSVALLTAALCISLNPAQAEQPSFNYIEGGYTEFEEFDGYQLRGSVGITDNLYVTGELQELSADVLGTDLDWQALSFGVGTNMPISDSTALFVEALYTNNEFEAFGNDESEDGHRVSLGARSMLTDAVEVYARLDNLEIAETATKLNLGSRLYVTNNVGLYAEYGVDDFDNEQYTVGASFKF